MIDFFEQQKLAMSLKLDPHSLVPSDKEGFQVGSYYPKTEEEEQYAPKGKMLRYLGYWDASPGNSFFVFEIVENVKTTFFDEPYSFGKLFRRCS